MRTSFNTYDFKRISKEKHCILKRNSQICCPAIFFDRDGVLIEDKHFISDPNDVELLCGARQLLSLSKNKSLLNIIVTNQSGIERGFFSWNEYENVTTKMLEIIGEPYFLDALVYSP